jgi:hypothetical protein
MFSGISTEALIVIEKGFVDMAWPVCATAEYRM